MVINPTFKAITIYIHATTKKTDIKISLFTYPKLVLIDTQIFSIC